MPEPPQLLRHTRNILTLSVALASLAVLVMLRVVGRFTAENSTQPSDLAPANEAGEPLLAVVSGTPIYGDDVVASTGLTIDPPSALPDFTLLSQEEQPVRLSDFRGKYILLFFGYTNCPDVCPLTLDGFRRIRADLEAELQEQLAFVFISVDGVRDTPQRLREYLAAFDVPVTALWGNDEEIASVGEPFGLVWQIVEPGSDMAMNMSDGHEHKHEMGDGGYLIDHTSSRFLIDTEGRLIRRYLFLPDPAASAALILADLRPLLADD